MPALDITQPQVMVDFPDDANFEWHHRVLLISLGGFRWICSTPTLSVQLVDLSNHRVIVLRRASAFPPARAHDSFVFDPADVTPAVLADLVSQAEEMAVVYGGVPQPQAAASDVVWRIGNASHFSFGEAVPAAVLRSPELFKPEEDVALVKNNGKWTTAARTGQQKRLSSEERASVEKRKTKDGGRGAKEGE